MFMVEGRDVNYIKKTLFLKGWDANLKRARDNGWPVHRDGKTGAGARRIKKTVLKTEWFRGASRAPQNSESTPRFKPNHRKTRQEPRRVSSALFVPRTPGGALADRLRKVEQRLATRIHLRIVEEAGLSLRDALRSGDVWAPEKCEREDCPVCISPKAPCAKRMG